jgi:ribonucleotide reductase beta subunit family protein with ferritin-like domain
LFGDPENLDPTTPEPYYSYERFAEEVLRRKNDELFLKSVCAFINELAASRERWLQEVLGVALLESLAQDSEFAATMTLSHHSEMTLLVFLQSPRGTAAE